VLIAVRRKRTTLKADVRSAITVTTVTGTMRLTETMRRPAGAVGGKRIQNGFLSLCFDGGKRTLNDIPPVSADGVQTTKKRRLLMIITINRKTPIKWRLRVLAAEPAN